MSGDKLKTKTLSFWDSEDIHLQFEGLEEKEYDEWALKKWVSVDALKPISEVELQDIMADFAVKQRLSRGICDAHTLECYRNGARDQAIKDFRFLQQLGLVLLRKELSGLLEAET